MAATASEAGLLEAMEVHQDQTACLVSLGISVDKARYWGASSKGSWRLGNTYALSIALSNAYWTEMLAWKRVEKHGPLPNFKSAAGS